MSVLNSVSLSALHSLSLCGGIIRGIADYWILRESKTYIIPHESLDELETQGKRILELVERIRKQ
jgi:hypothetical protein